MDWKTLKLDTSPCQGPRVVSRRHTNYNEVLSACSGNLVRSFVNYSARNTEALNVYLCRRKFPACKDPLRLVDPRFVEINAAGGESFHLCFADNFAIKAFSNASTCVTQSRDKNPLGVNSLLMFILYVICDF